MPCVRKAWLQERFSSPGNDRAVLGTLMHSLLARGLHLALQGNLTHGELAAQVGAQVALQLAPLAGCLAVALRPCVPHLACWALLLLAARSGSPAISQLTRPATAAAATATTGAAHRGL